MPQVKTKVEKYNNDLKGVISYNNKEYAIDNLIVGEEVELDISKDQSRVNLKKVLKESSNRVKPECGIYNKCGGCSLLHIKYQEQLNIKTAFVENLFFETFNKYYKVNDCLGMKEPWHYRNKNQIVFKNVKGGKSRIASGFYEVSSHNLVEFETCKVQDELSDKIVGIIKELMIKMRYNAFDEDRGTGLIRHVLIKRSASTKEVMVVIVTGSEIFPGCQNFVKALTSRCKDITTIIQNVNNRKTSAVLGDKEKVLYGKGFITDILLGKKFKISAKSFYQINSSQCEVLYTKALELANLSKTDILFDAYSGVGTIGLIASDKVNKVISVELVKDAVSDAIQNAKMNNIKNVHFFCDDASNFMKNMAVKKEKVDVLIMDPPRKGSDERFLNAAIKLSPKKIVYISCDPRTQVIDLKHLLSNGYQITAIQPVDMFPHTSHIETVTLLQRKDIDDRLKVRFDLENLPLVKEETKATYQEIKDYIYNKYNVKVSTLNIAQTKTKYGIIERECYNKPKDDDSRQPKCTREKEEMIIDALKHFNML